MKTDNRNITHNLLDSNKAAHNSSSPDISNKSGSPSSGLSLFEYSASDIFRKIKNVVGLGFGNHGKSFEIALKQSLSSNILKIDSLRPGEPITLSITVPSDDNFNTTFPNITVFRNDQDKFDLIYEKEIFASNLSLRELKSYCTTKGLSNSGLKKISDKIKHFKFHEIKTKLTIFKGSTIKWVKKLSAKTKYHIASFVKYKSSDEKLQKKLADTLGYLSGLGYKFENQHPITNKKNGEATHAPGKIKFSKENIEYIDGKIKLNSTEQLLKLCRKILASEEAFAILPSIIENIHNKDDVWNMLASISEKSPEGLGHRDTINKISQFEIVLNSMPSEKTDTIKNQCVQLQRIISCVEKNAPKRDASKIAAYYNNIQEFLLGKYDISNFPETLQIQIKKEIDLESGIAGGLYLNRQMCEFIEDNIISSKSFVSIKVQPHPVQIAFSYISCSKVFNAFTNKITDDFQSFLEEVNPQEFYQTKPLEELNQEILKKQKDQTNKTPDFALFLHGSDTKDAEGHADIDSNDSSNLKPQTFTRLHQIIKTQGIASEIIDGPTMLGENFTRNIAQGLIRCLQYIKKNRDDAQADDPKTIKIMITGHSRGAVEAIQINNILNELIKNGFKNNLPILRDLSDHHETINEQLKLIQNIDGINDVKFNLSVYAFDPVLGIDSSLTHRKGFDLPKIFNSANNVTNDYTIFVAEDEERGYFDLFLPKVVNMQSNKETTKITLVPLKSSHTDMVRYPKPNYKKQGGFSTTHNLLIDILNLDKKYYIADQKQHEYRYKKPTLLRRILQFFGYKGKTRTEITTHFNNKKLEEIRQIGIDRSKFPFSELTSNEVKVIYNLVKDNPNKVDIFELLGSLKMKGYDPKAITVNANGTITLNDYQSWQKITADFKPNPQLTEQDTQLLKLIIKTRSIFNVSKEVVDKKVPLDNSYEKYADVIHKKIWTDFKRWDEKTEINLGDGVKITVAEMKRLYDNKAQDIDTSKAMILAFSNAPNLSAETRAKFIGMLDEQNEFTTTGKHFVSTLYSITQAYISAFVTYSLNHEGQLLNPNDTEGIVNAGAVLTSFETMFATIGEAINPVIRTVEIKNIINGEFSISASGDINLAVSGNVENTANGTVINVHNIKTSLFRDLVLQNLENTKIEEALEEMYDSSSINTQYKIAKELISATLK